MDVVGSEIGQKMRSAIKAKLTELGCYVDDELPDYVMVMVANKRTREQMEDDLQLFLGDNTELFVNWLHQVLKKLQEVTVATPLNADKSKEKSQLKEKKSKDKKSKEKLKKNDLKKSKKKDKEKVHRKKEEKKSHKSKKKSKTHDMIRPNIPPLLMNMEKNSEPSITDVFAGQILKNHGITLDEPNIVPKVVDKKPIIAESKRPSVPIIDPATISSQPEEPIEEPKSTEIEVNDTTALTNKTKLSTLDGEEQLNQIEARIQGLKKKLADQLDSMSEDEDFLNIRTEADELMTDFAEDVFQELSQPPPVSTPTIESCDTPTPPPQQIPKPIEPELPKETPKEQTPETLPQIELKLPKRPIRERLGLREEIKKIQEMKEKKASEKKAESPERFTPEREPDIVVQPKPAKSRHVDLHEPKKRVSVSEDTVAERTEFSSKRLTSRVSVLENRPGSVGRVRPRPRASQPASSLLLRAVADAHRSLLTLPPKVNIDSHKVKRAMVLPMRRCVDKQKIVIQVPGGDVDAGDSISLEIDSEDDKSSKVMSDLDKDEYVPASITKRIINNDYVPTRGNEKRTSSLQDDKLIIESKNIHNLTVGKDKNTQFIVTMDGYHPNAFLAKKLQTEGLLNDDDEIAKNVKKTTSQTQENLLHTTEAEKSPEKPTKEPTGLQKKRLSDTSEESDTQVIIKQDKEQGLEKRKNSKVDELNEEAPAAKKKRASPIVFDMEKKEKVVEKERQRTESVGSDNHVTVVTTTNTHKYDSVPPLSSASSASDRKVWCRTFPLCRYGGACAFAHPRCKFAAACTRRNCVYSHDPPAPATVPTPQVPVAPSIASHVVPAANYKTISAVGVPNMCKYYPSCVNPLCHFYHPKPCRYGKNCVNKLECNFYHSDVPAKW